MNVTKGLPAGNSIPLEEAIGWAFNDLMAGEKVTAAVRAKFDQLFSDACSRGLLTMRGRRTGTARSEPIPDHYFDKGRGVWDGSAINKVPFNASLKTILASFGDGTWEGVWVDRAEFLDWFAASKSLILGLPLDDSSEKQVGEVLLTQERPPPYIGPIPPPAFGSSEYLKKAAAVRKRDAREFYSERVRDWNGSKRGPVSQKEDELLKTSFGLGRKDARKIRKELAPPEWMESGPKLMPDRDPADNPATNPADILTGGVSGGKDGGV